MPHLFIARSKATLGWLNELPTHWTVTVHDLKGDWDPTRLGLPVNVVRASAPGGLPGAYLNALATMRPTDPYDVTVFCPEDPLRHSPDFFALLEHKHLWGELQPLSLIGSMERKSPPPRVVKDDVRDHIKAMQVRAERFSLRSFLPVDYFDAQAYRRAELYRQRHELEEGVNLAAHFLRNCGMDSLAEEAESSDVGIYAHGHLFGIHNHRLIAVQKRFQRELQSMEEASRSRQLGELMFEHLWLHLLGEPFMRFDSNERPDEDVEVVDRSLAQVVASIDAVLAQSGGTPYDRKPGARIDPMLQGVELLRLRAMEAVNERAPDEAKRLLEQALARHPGHVGILTDSAHLAWRTGDLVAAVRFARTALKIDASASLCVYVVGMALAQGKVRQESIIWLSALLDEVVHTKFRAEHPDLVEAAERELTQLHAQASKGAEEGSEERLSTHGPNSRQGKSGKRAVA